MDDSNTVVISNREEGEKINFFKNKKFFWLQISLLILILGLVLSVYLIQRQTYLKSQAYSYTEYTEKPVTQTPSSVVEISNSYAFASPLKAGLGGEFIRVTVYVLDAQGMGIKGKSVEIGQVTDLQIKEVLVTTDDTGMAYFDISSSKAGLYIVQPAVEGKPLNQRINITFE